MRALMIRTGSVPVQLHSFPTGSLSLSSHCRTLSLHLDPSPARGLRRALSEPNVVRLVGTELGRSFSGGSVEIDGGDWPELGFCGGGTGKGKISGGRGGRDDWDCGDRRKIVDYYEEMLKLNPVDSLLLANYAKFLHEVVGDTVKAGEYYGRAILANPSDGETLSLYGKLIWETERDGERAKAYFNRALCASPEDSTVLGLYAHFMWEAEEDEDEEGERESRVLATLVEAF